MDSSHGGSYSNGGQYFNPNGASLAGEQQAHAEDPEDISNILDYLDDLDPVVNGNNDEGCFSMLQSLFNDDLMSLPASPSYESSNFEGNSNEEILCSSKESSTTHIKPPEPKKLCLPQPTACLHPARDNEFHVFDPNFDESNYAELSRLLDTRMPTNQSLPGVSGVPGLPGTSSFPNMAHVPTKQDSPVTPDLPKSNNSPGSGDSSECNSDDTGFRSGSSLSDSFAVRRKCSEPCIVVLKKEIETSRHCFEILQGCAQSINNFTPFKQLSRSDRGCLINYSWMPLFLLDMAQHCLDFHLELKNFCNLPKAVPCHKQAMCANRISQILAETNNLPTTHTAQMLKAMLQKIAALKLSTVEYFYFKLFVLFNSDLHGLRDREAIFNNRIFAENALRDCCNPSSWESNGNNDLQVHSGPPNKLHLCLKVIPSLYEVNTAVTAELFFRPVVGNGLDISDVVMEMFNSKGEELI